MDDGRCRTNPSEKYAEIITRSEHNIAKPGLVNDFRNENIIKASRTLFWGQAGLILNNQRYRISLVTLI
ncbi:hypothetical protein RB153_02440 [Paenibacillus larvae]|nr:hypothetical protein BXP28_16260 [Paenibacillus larvae subsp. larvae]MDR5594408.1 hypothetical protein [Paenibacillus larvae]